MDQEGSPTLQKGARALQHLGGKRAAVSWGRQKGSKDIGEETILACHCRREFVINLAVTPEVSSEYGSFAMSHMIIYFSSKKNCFYEKLQ